MSKNYLTIYRASVSQVICQPEGKEGKQVWELDQEQGQALIVGMLQEHGDRPVFAHSI